MKRLILLVLSQIAVICFVIEEKAVQDSNLGFKNETGSNTTAGQVTSFINFINSASSFYHDDIKARLGYISDQMNKTYPVAGRGYSIIQQGNESFFSFGVHTNVYASVAGVDKVFPTKSYIFIQDPVYTINRTFFTLTG